jgi:hypothetical protein
MREVRAITAPISDEYDPRTDPIAKKARAKKAEKAREDMGAIAILERRTRETTFPLELPGGDMIPIRSRIPRTEFEETARLFTAIYEARAAGDAASSERYSNELLGHLLSIEGMTPAEITAWIGGHPEAISDLDAEEIVIAFLRMRKEELERQQRLRTFREE